jgi:hypothetical protein
VNAGYLPVTSNDELAKLVVEARAIAFVEIREAVSTTCDYCPRDAYRQIQVGDAAGGSTRVYVCKPHARHAAICIVGTL